MVHILSTVLSSLLVVATISPSYASSTHSPFNSRHRKETNAQRLSRGVAPLPPTGVHAAKRGQPSGTSAVLVAYNIQVSTDNTVVGFLSNKYDSASEFSIFDPTVNEPDFMVVNIPMATDTSTPAFNLDAPSPVGSSSSLLALVNAGGGAGFQQDTTSYAYFTSSEPDLDEYGRPVFVGNDYDVNKPVETTIFTLGDNMELKVDWTNPDGSSSLAHDSQLVYVPDLTRLAYVADVTGAASAYAVNLVPATLTLVPVATGTG